MPQITRSEAFDIATKYNAEHRIGVRVREVLLLEELQFREPSPWGVSIEDSWIAYVERGGPPMFIESLIIVIDRNDGSILYSGGASDEG